MEVRLRIAQAAHTGRVVRIGARCTWSCVGVPRLYGLRCCRGAAGRALAHIDRLNTFVCMRGRLRRQGGRGTRGHRGRGVAGQNEATHRSQLPIFISRGWV